MPLWGRPDGLVVTGESRIRRFVPYLMVGRNESAVYHEQIYDLTRTRPWLRTWNRAHDQAATLFHLLLFAYARVLHERPGLNRFVSGGRLYQRRAVELSFAAKKSMEPTAPLVTVKVAFPAADDFAAAVTRIVAAIRDGRSDEEKAVDVELKLALALPSPLLRVVMWLLRALDRWNLLPAAMIRTDPMFASLFVANLGSVGLDRTYHHLYEYGNASAFAAIGTAKKAPFVTRAGVVEVRDAIEVRWTFDERINDGYTSAAALRLAQQMVEDPERYFGAPG